MFSPPQVRARALLVALLGAAALSVLSIPTEARAGGTDELVEYLPGNSQFAARVDVDALRGTKYFDRAVDFLEQRAQQDAAVPSVFGGSDAFDLRSDLDGFAVGLPVSRISPSQRVNRAVVAVEADFEESELRKYLEEEYSDLSTDELDDETTVYVAGDRAFVAPESNHLVAVMGPSSYRKQVWNLLEGNGASFAAVAKKQGLLAGIDTNRMIWMVNRISQPEVTAQTAAVAIQLQSGVDLQIVTQANSESNAKLMAKRAETMKESGAKNTMLRMLGAGPLVQNLEVERSGSTVSATTSMTDSEFKYLVERIRQLTQSQSSFSIPDEEEGGESETSDSEEESGGESDDSE